MSLRIKPLCFNSGIDLNQAIRRFGSEREKKRKKVQGILGINGQAHKKNVPLKKRKLIQDDHFNLGCSRKFFRRHPNHKTE